MSHRPQSGKLQEWTERMLRYESSQQSVLDFCQAEGISPPSFYRWKKLLPESSPTGPRRRGFQQVHVSLPVRGPARLESVIRLGSAIEIELGSDLTVVETIVRQLCAATGVARERS